MVAARHRGRDLCPGLCRDPGRDRRSRPPRLDLPEVLEVPLARLLVWWSTRRRGTLATTRPRIAISSFRFSLMASLGAKRCHQKQSRTAKMVLTAYKPALFQFAQSSNMMEPERAATSPAAWQARTSVMPVDTPRYRFHNSKEAAIPLTPRKTSLEQALEEAVSRALRDNLAPLQRTADELHHAYADLVAACGSSRPSNALPALLRAQTNAAALAAGLSVLSNFVAVALNPPRESSPGARARALASAAVEVEEEEAAASAPASAEPEYESEWAEEPAEMPVGTMVPEDVPLEEPPTKSVTTEIPLEPVAAEPEVVAFDVASLSPELKDLHRRANRAAKVSMQDIKLLRPKD